MLELPQALDVGRLQAPEVLPPGVDRGRCHPMLLRHLRDRLGIRLPEDRDHLLFGESGLLHGSLVTPGAILSGFRWSEKDRAGQ